MKRATNSSRRVVEVNVATHSSEMLLSLRFSPVESVGPLFPGRHCRCVLRVAKFAAVDQLVYLPDTFNRLTITHFSLV